MSVSPGTRIGPYEVLAKIGEGGMGQVFRARDRKLERDVALKVLPEAFASDADRLMRFTREARALASLNHPHIAQVYDTGREGAVAYIAMEFVDGEDLAARIRRAAVPLADALPFARQIADALAAAHEAGIVHRDLKPANIKVRDDGTVKVLDFGLAKGAAGDSSAGDDSAATRTSPAMTSMGVILGTASYMSPEQAKGKPVDRRADVWAFGVVLYEMLTGTFLFGREDVSDTLAAVLTYEPDLTRLPASTPPAIKRLLQHCLVKDKRQRLDSMAAARIEIDDVLGGKVGEAASAAPAGPASGGWLRTAALVAGGVALGAIASAWWPRSSPASTPASSLVARITAPRDAISAFHDGFALSKDGSKLAFAARNTSGVRQIWVRKLDGDTAQPIPGTDGALYPFWSPDARTIGFFADLKLRRVDEDGSRLQTICDAQGSDWHGSWNERDEILFGTTRGEATRVVKVSASGGTPAPFEALGLAYAPEWLTDGRRFLYVAVEKGTGKEELRLSSADGQTSQPVAPMPRRTQEFAYGGGLLFLNKNDALTAQRLDASTGALGSPVPIAHLAGNPKDWFAVSSNGHRVVALVREAAGDIGDPGDPMARLIWVDRQGSPIGTLGDSGRFWTLRLAPDDKSAVVNPGNDLWLLRPDGRHVRLTTGGIGLQSVGPVWNRDGSEMIYRQLGTAVRRNINPQSPVVKLDVVGTIQDWSSDGRWLLTAGPARPGSPTSDLIAYDFANKTSRPWLATDFSEAHARFSQDGTWVAYSSNVSGRQEVYLRPFEGNGQPVAVSTDGGSHPIWRRDAGELFFLSPGDDVMAVTLTRSGASITPGKPQRLFRIPLNDITRRTWAPYAVASDGQRFLLNVPDRPTPLFFLQGLEAMVK
jgi:Tol biopolymer transport system component/predicted Ser/Thr protein kinase